MTKWKSRLACGLLVVGTLAGAALAVGSQGTVSDPLVTLSYLNDVTLPGILKQVDDKIAQREGELTAKLQNAGAGSQAGSNSGFGAVELAAGGSVTLKAGAQLVLRQGSASAESPLTDLTTGETVTGPLKANHLYLASGDGQRVSASAGASVMIMGGYV